MVEFTLGSDAKPSKALISEDEGIGSDLESSIESDISLDDVLEVADPLDKVVAGLQTSADVQIPLQSVHVRAKLVDLAAEVVVLQEYKNEGNESIEAKYVFPLDEMAAVCGFEAFINGKHVIGQVKEKEQAHKEYKEAISKGHGAYLMDEEKPDVFTVSVGNLPVSAHVLIKITYVAELALEGELISFSIPGSVAPWRRDTALEQTTQTDVKRIDVVESENSFSLQVAVDMPFKIKEITSPTHSLKMKKTDTKAVVELKSSNTDLGERFQLLIGLAEIHVPRMWTEQNPDNLDNQACMLTFFPEFEDEMRSENEIVLVIDCSNSMKASFEDVKKVAMLLLMNMPDDAKFNVITFGTGYNKLFPTSLKKSMDKMKVAFAFIKRLQANKGSTDFWRVLRKYHLLAEDPCENPVNLFLLSDGHISEEISSMTAIKKNSNAVRLFTFGFGSTANRHLLTKMSQVGAGANEFFDNKAKSKWERKTKRQLEKAKQPALASVKVEWQQHDYDAPTPLQVFCSFTLFIRLQLQVFQKRRY